MTLAVPSLPLSRTLGRLALPRRRKPAGVSA
jgi:hypothetical protein